MIIGAEEAMTMRTAPILECVSCHGHIEVVTTERGDRVVPAYWHCDCRRKFKLHPAYIDFCGTCGGGRADGRPAALLAAVIRLVWSPECLACQCVDPADGAA